jgi:alpha-beta hydrolase superfamily lysophospholipase
VSVFSRLSAVTGIVAFTAVTSMAGCSSEPAGVGSEASAAEQGIQENAGARVRLDLRYRRLVVDRSFTGTDGLPLRGRVYETLGADDAYVVFLNGRTDFVEKYDVLFSSLHEYPKGRAPRSETWADLPVTFLTLDHAGQGASTAGRTASHVDDFDTFVEDVRKLVAQVPKVERHRKPIYVVSHSMGGLIAARFAQKYPDLVDGLVFESPLLGFRETPQQPEAAIRGVAYFFSEVVKVPKLCAQSVDPPQDRVLGLAQCGLGALESVIPDCQRCLFTPGGCDRPEIQAFQADLAKIQATGNVGCPAPANSCPFPELTTDDGYCRFSQTERKDPGPLYTWGWVNAVGKALDAYRSGPPIAAKTLILSRKDDVIVPTSAHNCSRFSGPCEVVTYEAGGHELYTSTERAVPIAATRAFLGF